MVMNALSVDVEEYYHAAIFRNGTSAAARRRPFESRVEASVDRLLALLSGTSGAGDVLRARRGGGGASVAGARHRRRGPRGRVPRRSARGRLTARRRASSAPTSGARRQQIEDLVGEPVIGYRAPNFSIGPDQSWAYRSWSRKASTTTRACIRFFTIGTASPRRAALPVRGLATTDRRACTEFPIGTARMLGVNLPIGGGGFFRLSPFALIRPRHPPRERPASSQPVMFYLHPWELDPDQPRPPMAWRHRFRHYVGVEKEATKLSQLLAQFRFGTARDVFRCVAIRSPSSGSADPDRPAQLSLRK